MQKWYRDGRWVSAHEVRKNKKVVAKEDVILIQHTPKAPASAKKEVKEDIKDSPNKEAVPVPELVKESLVKSTKRVSRRRTLNK